MAAISAVPLVPGIALPPGGFISLFTTFVHPLAPQRVGEVLASTFLSEGQLVREFESRLSTELGMVHPAALNSGTSALHLALEVAGMMMRRPAVEFGVIEQSAIKEAGNILSSAYMNALAEFMGMILMPSPPSLAVDHSQAVLSSTYVEVSPTAGVVLCVESEFILTDAKTRVRGLFLLLPDPPSLAAILRSLRV